jgi:hypothetical protein
MSSEEVEKYLDKVNNMARVEEALDHLACQFRILKILDDNKAARKAGYKLNICSDQLAILSEIYDGRKQATKPNVKRPPMAKNVDQLQQFTCFEQLIPEIRGKIWGYALPDAQVIEVYRDKSNNYNCRMTKAARKTLFNLLIACPESHYFVEIYYYYVVFDISSNAAIKAGAFLANPKTDILYFAAADQVFLNMDDYDRVYEVSVFISIAMPASVLKFLLGKDERSLFLLWIAALASLKTILVVSKEDDKHHGKELSLVPYAGTDCACGYQKTMMKLWADLMKEAGRDIELVWVDPYRNGHIAKGAHRLH